MFYLLLFIISYCCCKACSQSLLFPWQNPNPMSSDASRKLTCPSQKSSLQTAIHTAVSAQLSVPPFIKRLLGFHRAHA